MSSNPVMSPSQSTEFPTLHYLAFIGDHVKMKMRFGQHRTVSVEQITSKDTKERTPLHYAALTENLEGGHACVKAIVEFHLNIVGAEDEDNKPSNKSTNRKSNFKKDIPESTKEFINEKDVDGETALSLAAKNENPKIVEYLLLNSANVLSTCRNAEEQTLGLIYGYTPSAVTSLLDQSVFFDYEDKNFENVTVDRKYVLDLSAIVGVPESATRNKYEFCDQTELTTEKLGNGDCFFIESELLNSVNDKSIQSRNKILKHPLVQLFVAKKAEKLKYVYWFSLLIHIIWLGLYVWLVIDVYCGCCDCKKVADNITCVRYPFENWAKHKGKNETEMQQLNDIFKASLLKEAVYVRPIIILLFSTVILSKEIYKMAFLKLNYFGVKNMFMCAFFIILILTGWPCRKDLTTFIHQFQLAAFGIIISGQIILHRAIKHSYLAIYIKVLVKQFSRFLDIVPILLIIMITFATSLGMLFPDVNIQMSISMPNFRDSMMRVFEAISAGKLEWSSPYKQSINNNFQISGLIMYMAFYVIIILLFFKIMLGFVVADTNKIQAEEEVERISDDLESIFTFESFLFSRSYGWLSRNFSCFNKFRGLFVLCEFGAENTQWKVKISEKDIPSKLRKEIRILASKNLPSLTIAEQSKVDKSKKAKMHWFQLLSASSNIAKKIKEEDGDDGEK